MELLVIKQRGKFGYIDTSGNVVIVPQFDAAPPVVVPLLSSESFPTEPLPKVDARSSVADKITLFRALFRGRDDVYPMLWINERTGKKGYSPVVKGGWRHSHDENREYLQLTAEVYQEHLSGEKTIGTYPLLSNDACWFLACDFDGPDWIDDSESYLSTCKIYGWYRKGRSRLYWMAASEKRIVWQLWTRFEICHGRKSSS